MRLPLRFKLGWRSVRFYWKTNLALAMGIAMATSVLVGALLIGDSTRSSMSNLVEKRLGAVQSCLVASSFFRSELADEIADGQKRLNETNRRKSAPLLFKNRTTAPETAVVVAPAIQWTGALSVARRNADENSESPGAERFQPTGFPPVVLWGIDDRFSQLNPELPSQLSSTKETTETTAITGTTAAALTEVKTPAAREAIINQATADQFGLNVGDEIVVRIASPLDISPEISLGRKTDLINGFRLTVQAIVPDQSIGGITFRPQQKPPLNVFVNLKWLQEKIERPAQANVLLANEIITYNYRPILTDYGFQLHTSELGFWDVSSRRMVLTSREVDALSKRVRELFPGRPLTISENLLAVINETRFADKTIAAGESKRAGGRESLPYSILAASDDPNLPTLKEGEIAVNSWAAKQMGIAVGDVLTLEYFEPDSLDGQAVARTQNWKVAVVLPDLPLFTDPAWVPDIPGLTDKTTLETWDAPFPFDASRITDADEQYWTDFQAAPKFYISLEEGRRFFANRFGATTSIRVWNAPGPRSSDLAPRPQDVGWAFVPVRQQNLASALGATPFEVLFLALSFFVFAAALILILLLMRLNIDSRSESIGIMQTSGWLPGAIRSVFLYEGAIVALFGAFLGVFGGVLFAKGILLCLHTFWLGAIGVPFIHLTITPTSVAIGAASGLACAFLTIVLSLNGFSRLRTLERLKGIFEVPPQLLIRPGYRRAFAVCSVLYALAYLSILTWAIVQSGTPLELAARVFSLSIILLGLGVVLYSYSLRCGFIFGLSFDLRNHVRRPLRGVLSMGLVSLAVFVTVSMSAFRQNPSRLELSALEGNGNYRLFVETASPIFVNLNNPVERENFGFTEPQQKAFEQVQIVSLIVRDGDDASCGTLYKPRSPQIVGVPLSFLENRQFRWSDSLIQPGTQTGSVSSGSGSISNVPNPWDALWIKEYAYPLLQKEQIEQEEADSLDPMVLNRRKKEHVFRHVLPVIADQNTITYMLQVPGLNSRLLLDDRPGREVQGRLVGVLANGAFQGKLIADADQLRDFFPEIAGYRQFLIQCPAESVETVRAILVEKLEEYGVQTETIVERSTRLLAVQNTYLYAFESLGLLGALLGLSGLGAVVIRSLLERRKEMALWQAVGYSDGRIRSIVIREHLFPVLSGVINGILASIATAVAAGKFAGSASGLSVLANLPWFDMLTIGFLCVLVAWIACRLAVRSLKFSALVNYLNESV